MAESSKVEAHNVAVEVLEKLTEDEERERHRLFTACGKSVRLRRG